MRFSLSAVNAVALADMVRTLGRSSAILLLPVYFLIQRHEPFLVVGLVVSASSLLSAPVASWGGAITDRIGRRPLFTLLPLISFATFTLLFYEIFVHAAILILFGTFVLLFPVGSLQRTIDSTVISDIVPQNQRNRAFSRLRLASNVGFSLGPAVGGLIAVSGFDYLMLFPAFANLAEEFVYLSFVSESLEVTETRSVRRSFAFPGDDRLFLQIMLILVFCEFAIGQWGTTLTLFLGKVYSYSTAQIGLLYSVNGIVVVLLQLPVTRMMSLYSEFSSLIAGMFLYSITFLVFGLTSFFSLLVLDVIFLTVGENLVSPSTLVLISRLAPQSRRGEYFGSYSAVSSFASPAVTLTGVYVLSIFSHRPLAVWTVVAILALSSVPLLLKGRKITLESGR